jgi:hypothetical protein
MRTPSFLAVSKLRSPIAALIMSLALLPISRHVPAVAQPADTARICTGRAQASLDDRIRACSLLIAQTGDSERLAVLHTSRGAAWRAKDDLDRALADQEEAIRLQPGSALLYFNRAVTWQSKNDVDRAIADLAEAIQLAPDFVLAYRNRGDLLYGEGDFTSAISEYNAVVRFNHNDARALAMRGLAKWQLGDGDGGKADIAAAMRNDVVTTVALVSRARPAGTAAAVPPPAASPAAPSSMQAAADAAQVWTVMQHTTSTAVVEDFIRQFGTTSYGSLARARLDELKKQAATEAASAKAAAEAKAAEAARAKAEQDARVAAQGARIKAEEAKALAARSGATDATQRPQNLAAVAPSDQSTKPAELSPVEIVRQLQIELRRVGCFTFDIEGEWNENSGRALELFNKHSGMNLDTKAASLDALDVVRGKSSRVCPVICQRGFHADGERCVETICKAGFTVGDNDTCERLPEHPNRTAHPEPKAAPPVPNKPMNEDSKSASGGRYTICDNRGCREGPPGCKPKSAGVYGQTVVCE